MSSRSGRCVVDFSAADEIEKLDRLKKAGQSQTRNSRVFVPSLFNSAIRRKPLADLDRANSRGNAMKRCCMLVLAIAAYAATATPSQTAARLSDLTETTQAQPNYVQYYYGPYRRHVRRVYRRAYRRG